jgi:hypothetical protein
VGRYRYVGRDQHFKLEKLAMCFLGCLLIDAKIVLAGADGTSARLSYLRGETGRNQPVLGGYAPFSRYGSRSQAFSAG